MEPKPRLFIFERKEVTVLFLLAIFVAIFAFTLGIHFGKQLTPDPTTAASDTHESAGEAAGEEEAHVAVGDRAEQLPEKEKLLEAAKAAPTAGDDAVAKALQDEVAKTGIKLEKPIETDLPNETAPAAEASGKHSARPNGNFTLQVAAFPSELEAKKRLQEIVHRDESAFVEKAEVKNKTWYRVYVGGFVSKQDAEKRGKQLVSKRVIDGYVVSRMP